MNWIEESSEVPKGVWEHADVAQKALDKWKQDVDDNVRRTVKPPYNPMNWIDEKVEQFVAETKRQIDAGNGGVYEIDLIPFF